MAAACSRDAGSHESSVSEGVTAREPAPKQKAQTPEPAASARDAAQPTAAEPSPPAAPRPAQFRVAKTTGAAEHGRAPLGTRLRVPADAELSIDLVNGARVKLEPGSRAWLLDGEPATIVLLEGSLHAQLPPQGSAAGRPSLRVATADYAAEMAVSGEFWLARPAAKSGATPARPAYFAQLSGSSDLERPSAESEPGLTVQQLIAGQAWSGPAPTAQSPKGPRTLDEAKKAYEKLRAPGKAAHTPEDGQALLDRELAAWSEAEQKGKSLLEAQRAAKTEGDAAAVQAKQTDLVVLAKEKLVLRRRVRFAYERACERALIQFTDANSDLARFEATYAPKVAPALPSGS